MRALVDSSPHGFRPVELDALLGVRTANTLAQLVRDGRIDRHRMDRSAIHTATDPQRRQRQIDARRALAAAPRALPPLPAPAETKPLVATAIALFLSLLDEKQRRLFAGLASLLCGYGGDRRAAALLGLHRKTVSKGRRELMQGEVDPQRVRKPGAGRRSL